MVMYTSAVLFRSGQNLYFGPYSFLYFIMVCPGLQRSQYAETDQITDVWDGLCTPTFQQLRQVLIMAVEGGPVDAGLFTEGLDGNAVKGLFFHQADEGLIHFYGGIAVLFLVFVHCECASVKPTESAVCVVSFRRGFIV